MADAAAAAAAEAGGSCAGFVIPGPQLLPTAAAAAVFVSPLPSLMPPVCRNDSKYAPIRAPFGKVPYRLMARFTFCTSRAPTVIAAAVAATLAGDGGGIGGAGIAPADGADAPGAGGIGC